MQLKDSSTTAEARLRVEVYLPLWVKLTVLRVRNLVDIDHTGRSDCYVQVPLNGGHETRGREH